MTVEEKAKKIEEWCKNVQNVKQEHEKCLGCVLQGRPTCYILYEIDSKREEKIIEENYEHVFGGDAVHHPSHYQGKNECIDVMVAMFGEEAVKHFCMCNAYKYRYRADKKNGEEDIKKAEWYESKLIELGGIDGKAL